MADPQPLPMLTQLQAYAARCVSAERERHRAQVRFHLDRTTMSVYGTQPECKAARDALQRLMDDLEKEK